MKTNILLLLLSILSIAAQSQSRATTPEQCVDQYLSWKQTPSPNYSKLLFHSKAELRWFEGDIEYSTPAQDYIQKMEAHKQIDREHKLVSINTEGKQALAIIEEYYPEEELQTLSAIRLEKSKKGWRIKRISYTNTMSKISPTPHLSQKD